MQRIRKLPPLPARDSDANKGDCGRVLIVGGSRGMAGAPMLAAKAAYRSGAGLVKLAIPLSIWDVVAAKMDEVTTVGLPETRRGTIARRALEQVGGPEEWADVAVLGPGMSQETETADFIRRYAASVKIPVVLDADGLNAFKDGKLHLLKKRAGNAARVLTPHPGEMARLLGGSALDIQEAREEAVKEASAESGCIVVLKGAGTLVCDGERIYKNKTGNPGMATGGTGDVLAGVIGALIGQSLEPFEAACLGVHLHGLAGDIAVQTKGVWSLIAGDLIEALPGAFLQYEQESH
jgi:hydroxyethylthiazole kinase-like uncharacterized protein yjeF